MHQQQLNQVAVTHLLQHTLRSFCIHENSQWVYAVFWRILPRNYPPPKWDGVVGGAYDRSRGNRRNWILVWEDGFCNFTASTTGRDECSVYTGDHEYQQCHGLQPELFFKMSHEIYNYGEGLIGKVAADHNHKWIYKEPNDQDINFLSAWNNAADSHPRTWEAQFQSGIKTIALIAVTEGVIQLGSLHKVIEDLNYVVLLRKKLSYMIESIPGVLLPHPSAAAASYGATFKAEEGYTYMNNAAGTCEEALIWHGGYNYNQNQLMNVTPSMSSLEALLSKLPSVVVPAVNSNPPFCDHQQPPDPMAIQAKEEEDEEDGGECSSSTTACYNNINHHQHFGYDNHNYDLNVSSCMPNNGY